MHKTMAIYLTILVLIAVQVSASDKIDLSGTWQVQLDPENQGFEQQWYARDLSGTISLPGSTDQAGLGKKNGPETALNGRLTREYSYEGAAWYQREVDVPAEWIGKPIELYLERVHMESQLWVNGNPIGSQNSVSAAHRYTLSGKLKPGKNRISLRITNQMDIFLGRWSHSSSDETMGNWNGAVGKLELRCYPDQYLSNLRVGSDLSKKIIWVDGTINQQNAMASQSELVVGVVDPADGEVITFQKKSLSLSNTNTSFRVEMDMPETIKLWDEFTPNLYTARLRLTGDSSHDVEMTFGVRDISTKDCQFLINGRPTFMRGNLSCGAFPLTGYYSTDKSYWEKIIQTAKTYGLNHFRFHTYNPPHVAYEVADELGFYFCTEGPFWTSLKGDGPQGRYMEAEALRMLEEYGNYASFVMMGFGNEVRGDVPFFSRLMKELKAKDSRRLYNCDVNNPGKLKEPIDEADFLVTRWTKSKGTTLRLLGGNRFSFPIMKNGTEKDFLTAVNDLDVPLIAHENGQWVAHPSFKEIPKYTGVMKPFNLMHFQHLLERNGMGAQAEEIGEASARLAALLYKEDMEICFRTPNMGGFQLLQLQDFPGQGDALVGLLDVFWDSKEGIEPEEFRQGCSETMLLARFQNFVWSNQDTFTADVQVAHYGPKSFATAQVEWRLINQAGNNVGSGVLNAEEIPVGNVSSIGTIKVPLSRVSKASQLKLELELSGTPYKNSWPIWVYPENQSMQVPAGILVSKHYDQRVKKHLQQGGTVLLSVPHAKPTDDIPRIMRRGFRSSFWSFLWRNIRDFANTGILCDPAHPALADFPTESYATWQWSELLNTRSRAFVLNELPDNYRPIVQSIDTFQRAWKLGALFEGKVGNGKIMVSGIDLHSDMDKRKVASQLRNSLLQYMQSEAFNPTQELDLDRLYEKSISTQKGVLYASSTVNGAEKKGSKSELEVIQSELGEFDKLKGSSAAAEGAAAAFDLNWASDWYMDGVNLPQEVQIDLKRTAALNGLVYKPTSRAGYRVRKFDVYVKNDLDAPWEGPVLEYEQYESSSWFAALRFKEVVSARYLRFVIKEGFDDGNVLGVAEFEPWFK